MMMQVVYQEGEKLLYNGRDQRNFVWFTKTQGQGKYHQNLNLNKWGLCFDGPHHQVRYEPDPASHGWFWAVLLGLWAGLRLIFQPDDALQDSGLGSMNTKMPNYNISPI